MSDTLDISNNGYVPISFDKSLIQNPDETLFTTGYSLDESSDYNGYGADYQSVNTKIISPDMKSSQYTQNLVQRANDMNLTAQQFSDYVELGIVPTIKETIESKKENLQTIHEDKTIVSEPIGNSGSDLLTILKSNSDIMELQGGKLIEVLDHLTTLFHNQNQIHSQSNEIAISDHALLQQMRAELSAHNKLTAQALLSITKSLEGIPILIDTIKSSNEAVIEQMTISNSHRFQKNVNDAYAFNYNKDDENGSETSLRAISSGIANIAGSHAQMVQPIKNQGDWAKEEKEIIDEENAQDFLDIVKDKVMQTVGVFEDELEDFDIFTYLLENTTEAGLKNDNQ